MKNIFILAAENSAENYGARVIEQFNHRCGGQVSFFGVGGERFIEKGVDVFLHNREFSVIGIIEVLSSIFKFRRYMKKIVNQINLKQPAAALLIDFPDFNLRLAKRLKRLGVPVYYYISPTVWAWRYSRVRLIRRYVRHLFIIFPFEKKIYERERIPFTYTGHPLIPMIRIGQNKSQFRKDLEIGKNQIVITLLPGSRPSEVKFMLPEMVRAVEMIKRRLDIKVFILKAHNIDQNLIGGILEREGCRIPSLEQETGHELINSSDFIITTCGTSNLEIAAIGIPFVACYRVHWLSYFLGIHLVKIRLYSIVNILANQKVVTELIQKNFRAKNIYNETIRVLEHPAERRHMLEKFRLIRESLKQNDNPSKIVFEKIYHELFPESAGREIKK